MLELDGPVPQLKVIHDARTKRKGSTCAFTESVVHCCGFRTGLFTSPQLMSGSTVAGCKYCSSRLSQGSGSDFVLSQMQSFPSNGRTSI